MKQQTFLSLTGKSLIIWSCTNAIATICYCIYMLATGAIEPLSSITSVDTLMLVVVCGLVFSFPVILFLIPGLYVLGMFRHTRDKVVYAIGIVLFLSLGVVVFFIHFTGAATHYDRLEIVTFLLPYVIGAMISFFLVARKMIFSNFIKMTITTSHLEKL